MALFCFPVPPLVAIEKPQQGRREKLVSEDEYSVVHGAVKDQEFRDLLELSWETGCRPRELFTEKASYVDLPTGRWVFPIRLSKGKKMVYQSRAYYFTGSRPL